MLENKSQRIYALGIITILLLSTLSLGENEASSPAPENMNLEQFRQNPTLENFNQMTPENQALFLAEPGNYERYPEMVQQYYTTPGNVGRRADIDNKYFNDADNIGKNPAADDNFFSGHYSGGNSRMNFHTHRESASKYLQLRFNAHYIIPASSELAELPEDFSFNLELGTLTNNGKKITFSQFQNDRSIREVRVIREGFRITRDDNGVTQEISVQGDAEREIRYDRNTGQMQFHDTQDRVQHFDIRAATNSQSSFSFHRDGSLTVTGPVSGQITTNNDFAEFTNYAGTLTIQQNGDLTAANAEVRTSHFYGNGNFEKRGNTVTARDHGDADLGNLVNQRTVVIDIPSRIGATTQNAEGTMTVHLGEIAASSEFHQATAAVSPENTPNVEELRQQARQIRAPSGDLGKNSEVWINRNNEGVVTVSAKGPVEVGFYNIPAGAQPSAAMTEPHFIGENGISELDLQVGPQTKIILRGKTQYSDDQYRVSEGERYGIHTFQDGSVMHITRTDGRYEDSIYADCYNCQAGQHAAEIQKTIALATPSRLGRVLIDPELLSVNLAIDATDDGLRYNFPLDALGTIAQQQAAGRSAVLGRDIVMKIPCAESQECNFQLTREQVSSSLQGFYEQYNPETQTVAARIPINTGGAIVLGQAIILTSDKNKQSLETLIALVQGRQFQQIRETQLEFDSDPALRAMILQETGLDIESTGNPAYMQRIGDAVQRHARAQEQIERLQTLGIHLDAHGRPASAEDAAKINRFVQLRVGNEFWLYTAIQMNLARADTIEREATFESCAGSTTCPVTQAEVQQARRSNNRVISMYARQRDVSVREERVRQIQRQMERGILPADGEDLRSQAIQWGRERIEAEGRQGRAQQDLADVNQRIAQLDTQIQAITEMADLQQAERMQRNLNLRREQIIAESRDTEESILFAQSEVERLTAQAHAEHRPDVAAEVLYLSGDSENAQAVVAESPLIPVSVRNELQQRYAAEQADVSEARVRASIDSGDLPGAARELRQIQSHDPDSAAFRIANAALAQAFIQQGEQEAQTATHLLIQKQMAAAERRNGFFSWMPNIASIIGLIEGAGTVGEVRETIEDRAIEHFDNRRHSILRRNQIIDAYQRHGLTPDAALEDIYHQHLNPEVLNDPTIRSIYPEMAGQEYQRVTFATNANTGAMFRTALGQELTSSDRARIAFQEAEDQETFYDGKTGLAEDYFRRAAQYSDTPEGRDAQARLDDLDRGAALFGLISNRALDRWAGDIALDSFTVDWLIPGVAFTKPLSAATKAAVTTARFLRLAEVAEHVAQASRLRYVFASGETLAALNTAREAVQVAARGTEEFAHAEEALAAAQRIALAESRAGYEASILTRRISPALTERGAAFQALAAERRVAATSLSTATRDLSRATRELNAAKTAEAARTAQETAYAAQNTIAESTAAIETIATQQRALRLAGTETGTWFRRTALGRERSISRPLQTAQDSFLEARQAYQAERQTVGAARVSEPAINNLIHASEEVEHAERSFRLGSAVKGRLGANRVERNIASLPAGVAVSRTGEGRFVARGLDTLSDAERVRAEELIGNINRIITENPEVSRQLRPDVISRLEETSGTVDRSLASVDTSVVSSATPTPLTPAENERLDVLVKQLTDEGAEFNLEGSHIHFTPESVPIALREQAAEAERLLQRTDYPIIESVRLEEAEVEALANSLLAEAHNVQGELVAQRAGLSADALPAVTTETVTPMPVRRLSPEVRIAAGDDIVRASSVEQNFDEAAIGLRRGSRLEGSALPQEQVLERLSTDAKVHIQSLTGNTFEGRILGVDADEGVIYLEQAGQQLELPVRNVMDIQPVREITTSTEALVPVGPEIRGAEESVSELAETGRLDLHQANTLPPTERQIQRGQQLQTQIQRFSASSPGSPEFQQAAEEMYRTATQDTYGALKLPEFERRVSSIPQLPNTPRYTLYEISLDRETLKGLNTRSYEIGSTAIDRQHRLLVQFAQENGLEVTTLQKTTYLAVPAGTRLRPEEILAAIQRTESSVAEAARQPVRLRVGIADSQGTLMETRLHTRRSLRFSSESNAAALHQYDREVQEWYNGLSLEDKSAANDIFQGYDSALLPEFEELERLRTSGDAAAYRERLMTLAQVDLQDARFSSLEVVKNYQANSITGVRQGDALVSIDGIGLGEVNKADIQRLTERTRSDTELAGEAGRLVDNSIREVNDRIRQAYFNAVDRVNIQSVDTLGEYDHLAEAADYSGSIQNTNDLKAFLKWEFEHRGRFRGGDEAFMTLRREVLRANPDFGRELQNIIRGCGEPCGYNIRVGVREVREGEPFIDVIADADRAVSISKELGDVPVRIDAAGNIIARNLNLQEFEIVEGRVLRNGKELSDEAARAVLRAREDAPLFQRGERGVEKLTLERPAEAKTLSGGATELTVDGEVYVYRPGQGYFQERPRKGLARILGTEEVPVTIEEIPTIQLVALESARLEAPVEIVSESVRGRFADIAYHSPAGTIVSPADYERYVFKLVDKVGDGRALTKENIRELVLLRARNEVRAGAMSPEDLIKLKNDFDKLYERTQETTQTVARFSEILSQQTPGYTDVHLFRDGSMLGASDDLFQKLRTGQSDVRIIYVSRDTTLSRNYLEQEKLRANLIAEGKWDKLNELGLVNPLLGSEFSGQSNWVRIIMSEAKSEAEQQGFTTIAFNQIFHQKFAQLMELNPEFRDTALRTYDYLVSEGIVHDGAKLRFIDTCCSGSINLYLEGIVHYYQPDILTESLLMSSENFKWLDAGLKTGIDVEYLHQPVSFARAFDSDGRPLMEIINSPESYGEHNQVLSYMDQLIALQQTAERAHAAGAVR